MNAVEENTTTDDFAQQFEDFLKSSGLRLTQKRMDVLNQVFAYPGLKCHRLFRP